MEKERDILQELGGISRMNPFTVPDGYFNSLTDNVLQRIQSSEEAVREQLPGENPYRIPEGYFDTLANRIADRVAAAPVNQPAPVISISRHKPALWKYLTAAAISIGIIISATVYFHYGQGQNFDNQLAKVSDQAIEQYLQYHTDVLDNEQLYGNISADSTDLQGMDNNLSSDDIQEYLNNNIDIPDTTLN